jgi:hypothetical protein
MARILVETDGGETTLSEKLVSENLTDGDYAAKLVARVGWALSDAEAADRTQHVVSVRALSAIPAG